MDATELSVSERAHAIIEACERQESANPLEVFWAIEALPFVRMHGPEHHVLDGAAFLTAFHNAGGAIDLPAALDALVARGLAMPGAICGLWGVCGSAASVGAALAIIEGTGPLTDDASWGSHMELAAAFCRPKAASAARVAASAMPSWPFSRRHPTRERGSASRWRAARSSAAIVPATRNAWARGVLSTLRGASVGR